MWAGVDSAWEQEKLEARKMLENAAESHRSAEDHTHIQQFTNAFRDIPGIQLVNDPPVTNMLHFTLTEQAALSADTLTIACEKEDIILRHRNVSFRLVTHYWIDDAAVEKTINLMQRLLV
jgi:threonine aldolase